MHIALISALKHSVAPTEDAFRRLRIATFTPTLASTGPEFDKRAPDVTIISGLAEGVLATLDGDDPEGHDQVVLRAAAALADFEVIALSRFSLARAAGAIGRATGKIVLATPDSAARKLRRLLLPTKAA